jgi:elongation factor Ts
MAITAQDVNKLRQITGAGMMDCKKALTEANGDFEAAIDILRKKGQKISANRADRETKEGIVRIASFNNDSEAVMIALGCETDFVAKNEDFLSLADQVLALAQANAPADVEKLNSLPASDARPMSEVITDYVGKIGEKISVVSSDYIKAEKVITYIHANGKIGVLVGLDNVGGADFMTVGKDVCMQIAAMNPIGLDENSVDARTIEREMEIARERAVADGKPANLVENIAQGAVKKFLKENTLLSMPFVKDNKLTIAQYVSSVKSDMKVTGFKRVQLG